MKTKMSLKTRTRGMLVLLVALGMLVSCVPVCQAGTNLLQNPGFETFPDLLMGSSGSSVVSDGWTVFFPGAWSYGGNEVTHHSPSYAHSGQGAAFVSTESNGWVQYYQDIPVAANTQYEASLWMSGLNIDGQGFGSDPGDHVWLAIELQRADHSVVGYPGYGSAGINSATPYVQRTLPFTTTFDTAIARVFVDVRIMNQWPHGRAMFDDAALVAVPEPSSFAALGFAVASAGLGIVRRKR